MELNWLETTDWKEEDGAAARLIRFRKEFERGEITKDGIIRISADTRYKLYINGTFVQYGPSKGDNRIRFYDEMDITPYLSEGRNTAAVLVLHYPLDGEKGNQSLFRFETPRLGIGGLSADGWKTITDRKTVFYREEVRFSPLQIHEKAEVGSDGWKYNGFDDQNWSDAVITSESDLPDVLKPGNLSPRTIPYMYRKPHAPLMRDTVIPEHSERTFVLDANEEMCGFITLKVSNGAGANIRLRYSECYEYDGAKGNRLDAEHGHLSGYCDYLKITGEREAVFEPYWFRTFRFIEVSVETRDEPLVIHSLSYEETGYPLEVKTSVETDDPSFEGILDISLRTLRRCMQETYIDCPYYEQLQYIMDTRSQILYTYAVSADDRLARKAIDDFSRAQRSDGLLNCSYPNTNVNVIPGFSIYYILMVYDHMMYFGDPQLVENSLPVIDGILNFFNRHLNEAGIVEKTGGRIDEMEYWSFIDWAKEWMETDGMPKAGLTGPVTMESLLYILGLNTAAMLSEYVKAGKEQDYRKRAEEVKEAVRKTCMNESGILRDGPGKEEYSVHAQVFGILSGTLSHEEGRSALETALKDETFAGCSVAMCYYLFRAMEKTGLYAETERFWNVWRTMVNNGCTTCVEAEYYARSECHAWGALALYELPSVILGVRPASPGYETIRVAPLAGHFRSASGTIITPKGEIRVSWKQENGEIRPIITCSEQLRERIITD